MRITNRVLIIDNELSAETILCRKLKEMGCFPLTVRDYSDGLGLMRKIKDLSLIVLNIESPGANGLDFYDALKKEFPEKKIMICSQIPQEEQRFLVCDADDYFCKTEEVSIFLDKVNKLLRGPLRKEDKDDSRQEN